MSTLKRAVGNSSILMVSQLITWSASIILVAALGRHLGDAGFGNLYLAMAFAGIFVVLVEFGLNQQLVRAVARDRSLASTYLVNSVAIKTILGVVAYVALLVISHLLRYSTETKLTIAIYSVILLFRGLSTALTAVYQACENVRYVAMGTILDKVFISGAAVLLLSRGYGVLAIAALFAIGELINVIWQACFLRRVVQVDIALSGRTMRMLIAGALPFFLYWALGSVYYRVDIVLLSKLTDAAVVGWYGAAYKLFDTLVFLPGIVCSAIMLPILSRLSVTSRDDLRLAMSKGLEIMLMLGIPICTGLFALAEPIIRFIYHKPEFLPAVPALRWLAVALFLLYINSVLTAVLVSLNQEKKMTVVAGLATVFNLGLNWALIPQFQHLAAAAVTAGTEFLILGYLLVCVPKDLLSRGSLIVLLKTTTAAAIMVVVLTVLRGQSLLLLVPVGGLAYCLSSLALRVVPPEDIRVFRQAIAARHQPNPVGIDTVQA